MLVMKDNYNKKIAPFDFDYESRMVIPVNVNISMAVMDVLSISETDLVYVLKFRFLMVWYDYRLKYHNLKERRSLNSLSRNEIDKVQKHNKTFPAHMSVFISCSYGSPSLFFPTLKTRRGMTSLR